MPKRFTDTEKWKDEWYLSLSNDYRIVWQYLLDNCTHAGILKKNLRLLNFCCNTAITEADIMSIFEGRVVSIDGHFFIPKFLKFQYPQGLGSEKPVIRSVRTELEKFSLQTMVTESFGNGYLTIKDKVKDKYKDKDKDKALPANHKYDLLAPTQHLNQVAGRNFDPSNKATQRLIHARYEDGHTLDDFKRVIDTKTAEWLKDEKMEQYLRPNTLFCASKFEGYLNQRIAKNGDGGLRCDQPFPEEYQ